MYRSLVLGLAALGACSSGSGGDASSDPSATPRLPGALDSSWGLSIVAEEAAGLHLRAALSPNDEVMLAYFAITGRDVGECEELGDSSRKVLWDLYVHDTPTSDARSVGEFAHVGTPQGLGLGFGGTGQPTIVTMTGEPDVDTNYCGVNDVGVLEADGAGVFSNPRVLVADGDEAVTGEPASDFGPVVGYWPGIAWDGSGTLHVAYKDVHNGSIQSDDLRRADLEFVGDGQTPEAVDFGKGAGNFNALVFDNDDVPYIVYYNPVLFSQQDDTQGLWVTRKTSGSWEKVLLSKGGSLDGPSIAVEPSSGTLYVAYYDSDRGVPVLASLTDPSSFASLDEGWTVEELGDQAYDEGYDPALAFDEAGSPVLVYYRCALASAGIGNCNAQDDALIFAYKEGDAWTTEVIDSGDTSGQCGRYPQLVKTSGELVAAYQCEALDGEVLRAQVRVAASSERL